MSSNDRVNRFWLIWHDLNAVYEDYARRVPECTQKSICACTSLPKQNVNALIKKFAEDGIVELAPNEADRRNKTIHLTDKGRQLHQSVIPHIREAEIKAMQSLPEEEQNTMIRTLETYVSALTENL